MNIHVFQHVPFEGLRAIQNWIDLNQFNTTSTHFFAQNPVRPNFENIDLLVILGGSMSIHDEKEYPWLIEEKKWISEAIQAEVKILGICLGAQLIADVLGADVAVMQKKEIGWFPIKPISPSYFFDHSSAEPIVLHWHGEAFDIPKQATALFKSDACSTQAFEIQEQVLGLQFHLEFNKASVESILNGCADELTALPNTYIQNKEKITTNYLKHADSCHQLLFRVLDKFK